MVTYEVLELSSASDGDERLLGHHIDTPGPGSKGNLHLLHIVGWVLGRESRPVQVEVLYHGRVIRASAVRGRRPDVAAAFPGTPDDIDCNFHALLSLVGLKPRCELALRVVLEDGARVPLAVIKLARRPLESGFRPRLQPLLVTCLGRTGTTWVMKLLASHPQIVTFRRFPYEATPAKYWLHMLKVLSEPANIVQSADTDTFHNNPWWVGHNPYVNESVFEQPALANWFGRNYIERLAYFCQDSIEDWYTTLARNQSQDAPVYFAEKHMWPNFLPVLTWELYPQAKEIFLVRDFRDMACSILAFDRKRGYSGFGHPEGKSDTDYVRDELASMASDLVQSWRTRGERGHLLRYEDLASEPARVVADLLEYLEVEASQQTVENVLALAAEPAPDLPGTSKDASELDAHRTAPDLGSSIGRWRREPDEAFRELLTDVFREPLLEFGYELADEPAARPSPAI